MDNSISQSNKRPHSRERFKFLKTMYRQAPLRSEELEELKFLAAKFDKRMDKWFRENPEQC